MTASGAWLLKCICDDTRFEMLEMLIKHKELCVGDFVTFMSKDQPLISHHIKKLKECGIVASRYEGRKTMYFISGPELATRIAGIAEAGRMLPNLCEQNDNNGTNNGPLCGC